MAHVIPETPTDFDQTRVIERPDGSCWQPKSGGREYGPSSRHRSYTMRAVAGIALLSSVLSAQAQPVDGERGRLLYENHCQFCHTPRVHSRPSKPPITRNEVRGIVDHWQRYQNLGWTEQETEDVVEYLNRSRYRFAPGS